VCDLGAVGASSILGLVRGAGAFATVLPTFVLVSRMQLAQQYRGNGHFLSAASSSRHEAMVDGALTRGSALRVGLGVRCNPVYVRHVDSSTPAFSLSSHRPTEIT
jgi:hypothetical protein